VANAQSQDGDVVWRERVENAALAGDADELRLLFAEAQKLFGDDAGTRWAEALSAVDSSAVTG
jgi:hypothetical protein